MHKGPEGAWWGRAVGAVELWDPDHIAMGSHRSGEPARGNGVVKVGGIPHSFFLCAKQKLASLWR